MPTDSFLGLARAFSELQLQFADIEGRESGLRAQIDELSEENAALERDIEHRERDIVDEKTKTRALHGDIETLRREKLRLEALLEDDREAARDQDDSHRKEIAILDARLNEASERRRSLEERLAHVTHRYQILHAHFAAAKTAHEHLQNARLRLSALEQEIAAQTNARAGLERELGLERERVMQLVSRCEAWQTELAAAGEKHEALNKKFAEHRSLIERWVAAYRKLEKHVTQIRDAHAQDIARWQRFAQNETARATALENELRDVRQWIEKNDDRRDLAFRLEKALEENRALREAQIRWQAEADLWRRRSRDAEDHGNDRVRRAQEQSDQTIRGLQRALDELRTETRRTGRPYSSRAAQNLESSVRSASKNAEDRNRVIDLIEKFSKDIPSFDDRQPPPPPADALPKTK